MLVQPASIKATHQCSLSSQSYRQTPGQSSQDPDLSNFNYQNGCSPQTCSTSVCHMKIQQPINFQAVTYQSLTVMDHTAFPIFKAEIFPSMKSTLFSFLQSNAVKKSQSTCTAIPKCTNQQCTVKILHCTVISSQNPITSPSWWMICCCHGRGGVCITLVCEVTVDCEAVHSSHPSEVARTAGQPW